MNRLSFEHNLFNKGVELIAGVDEVGRGALAGPMVAGAVILDKNVLLRVHEILTNNDVVPAEVQELQKYTLIKDSKLLTPKKREGLAGFIKSVCVSWSVFQISPQEIDTYNIPSCTQKAFYGVIKGLSVQPDHILTDAFRITAFPELIQTNIVGGDNLSLTIGAASIVAKVFRDSLMTKLSTDLTYACYEFHRHKGYGTKLHFAKIAQYGISPLHRKSFIL